MKEQDRLVTHECPLCNTKLGLPEGSEAYHFGCPNRGVGKAAPQYKPATK